MNEEVTIPSRSLIEGLLEELEALPHRDEQRLDALRQRGAMVLRNIYGPGSRYVTQFIGVSFKPNYLVMKSGAHDRWWNEGVSRMRNLLSTMLAEIDTFPQKVIEPKETPGPTALTLEKIFVVHGHDNEMLSALESFIMKLGLKPVILRNQPSRGRTIVEKIEDYSDVSSAVVLLSPDDSAYPRGASSSDAKFRARQNVIFELGFFIGKLGRHNVIAVHRTDEHFEMPTDYEGVIFTPYDDGGGWKLALAKELQAIGFRFDAANLLEG
jgi:predicted nucleotide-binding protein